LCQRDKEIDMSSHYRRTLLVACLIAGLGASCAGCTSSDTTSSLIDWAATTTAGLVQIVVKAILTAAVTASPDPVLDAPISQQQH
jgi:hypothetical protein